MMSVRSFALAASAFAIAVLLAGCGSRGGVAEGRTKPVGRVLDNGLPIKAKTDNLPPGDPGMRVIFIRLGGVKAGEETEAQIISAADATFELIGADGKGIEPGKYRVAVTLGPFGSADQLGGKYTREKSPIEIDVKSGEDLVIDVAKFKK